MKFSIKCFFSKCDQFLWIWSHLLKKSLMENFIFYAVQTGDAFHLETRHSICTANPMTGFYMKRNTWLRWVNTKFSKIMDISL